MADLPGANPRGPSLPLGPGSGIFSSVTSAEHGNFLQPHKMAKKRPFSATFGILWSKVSQKKLVNNPFPPWCAVPMRHYGVQNPPAKTKQGNYDAEMIQNSFKHQKTQILFWDFSFFEIPQNNTSDEGLCSPPPPAQRGPATRGTRRDGPADLHVHARVAGGGQPMLHGGGQVGPLRPGHVLDGPPQRGGVDVGVAVPPHVRVRRQGAAPEAPGPGGAAAGGGLPGGHLALWGARRSLAGCSVWSTGEKNFRKTFGV